jgi:CO/xanthine dehydrogenase Mo-binding subunit
VYRGVGISSYVEGTGIGPFEGAVVRLDPSGKVLVSTGACSQGQGHETVYAQIVADALGVTPADVASASCGASWSPRPPPCSRRARRIWTWTAAVSSSAAAPIAG